MIARRMTLRAHRGAAAWRKCSAWIGAASTLRPIGNFEHRSITTPPIAVPSTDPHRAFRSNTKRWASSSFDAGFPHDVGGSQSVFGPVPGAKANEDLLAWEQQCHAMFAVLAIKGIVSTDELRRSVEALTPAQYEDWSYYERWSAAMTSLLLDKGVIGKSVLMSTLIGDDSDASQSTDATPKFTVGQPVRVKPYLSNKVEWRRPHVRTPGYIYGVHGEIERICDRFADPSFLAFGMEAPPAQLYRVRFRFQDIWPEQHTGESTSSSSSNSDVVEAEVYEHWLEASDKSEGHAYDSTNGDESILSTLFDHTSGGDCEPPEGSHDDGHNHIHSHDHSHGHGHGDDAHTHEPRQTVERRAVAKEGPPRPGQALHAALLKILVEANIISPDEIRVMCEKLDTAGKNLLGASLVLRAWTDPGFRDRLLADAPSAAREMDIETSNPNAPTVLTVVPNTDTTHNIIVCTLCSCYPSGLLGIAPAWYKSREYRSRAVREPRSVLSEFGLQLPSAKSIRVHDSTADHRYLVLPERPEGTEGWSDDELRRIITRDTMLGVAVPKLE